MTDMADLGERAQRLIADLTEDPRRTDLARMLHFLPLDDAEIGNLLPSLREVSIDHSPSRLLCSIRSDWEWIQGDQQLSRYLARTALDENEHSKGVLPHVLIIGAPKSGTTSLLAYLRVFPELWRHPRKELHYFDGRWQWGSEWYQMQFPSAERLDGRLVIEATPDYLQSPLAPERAAKLIPDAKLIVLLREPLRRAVSAYEHRKRMIGASFDASQTIAQELKDLEKLSIEDLAHLGWRDPNCIAGSLYPYQIARWLRCYEEHQILMLRFEDLVLDPSAACQRVAQFLGLSQKEIPPEVRETLGQAWNVAPEPYPPLSSHLAGTCRRSLLRDALLLWQNI